MLFELEIFERFVNGNKRKLVREKIKYNFKYSLNIKFFMVLVIT